MKNIYIYILIGSVVLAVSYYIYSKKYDNYKKDCSKEQCIADCLGDNSSYGYCKTKCNLQCPDNF